MAGLVKRQPTKKITASEARRILGFKSNKTVVKRAKEGHFKTIHDRYRGMTAGSSATVKPEQAHSNTSPTKMSNFR
jgi:hypothetical protein